MGCGSALDLAKGKAATSASPTIAPTTAPAPIEVVDDPSTSMVAAVTVDGAYVRVYADP